MRIEIPTRTDLELFTYQNHKKLKKLTQGRGLRNDLYLHPIYGTHTLEGCIYEELVTSMQPKPKPQPKVTHSYMSDQMAIVNERCIELYGCAAYG